MRVCTAAVLFAWCGLFREVSGYTCPNYCSGRGMCGEQGVCTCPDGWTGADCSLATCPMGKAWADEVAGTDDAHNLAECSNRGLCDRVTGRCNCDDGFTGIACDRMSCTCNGRGRCESMERYALTKDPGLGDVYTYVNNWDSEKIYGCVCDEGFTGPNCEEQLCPVGDDPLTGTSDDPDGIQRNEKQRVSCKATSGTFTLTFRGYTTVAIDAAETKEDLEAKLLALPSIHGITLTYSGVTLAACTSNGNDITIEFTQDFGDLPNLLLDGTNLVHSTSGEDPTLTLTTVTEGTKESLQCSRRGRCDPDTGNCACYTNFFSSDGTGAIGQRGDCGHVISTVTACPGEIACSGHGTCRGPPTYDCICNEGFTGGDCNELICPTGKAWFDRPIADDEAHQPVECSGVGTCDRVKGNCICNPGFTGSSCNRLECPNDCNGHGTCYTMEDLAKRSRYNKETMDWTYGEVPNKKETWDYDMISGCLCSEGWEGHDCSLQSCPTGDDPMTRFAVSGPRRRQVNEKQVLTCTGNSGVFTLTFRDQTTSTLPYSITDTSLKSVLEGLSSIGEVSVTYSSGYASAPACTDDTSNVVTIEFLTDFGDLPSLRYAADNSLTISIDVDGANGSQRGTKEEDVCANRGICNHVTGQCTCMFGFSSSDGRGNSGDRGDCGYKMPIFLDENGRVAMPENQF